MNHDAGGGAVDNRQFGDLGKRAVGWTEAAIAEWLASREQALA